MSFSIGAWFNILFVFMVIKALNSLSVFFFKTYFNNIWFDYAWLRWSVDLLFLLSCVWLIASDNYISLIPRIFKFRFSGVVRKL